MYLAFVTPNGVAGIDWDEGSKDALRRLVAAARSGANATRIVISMGKRQIVILNRPAFTPHSGGWSGCHWMSQAMSTASNRAKLCDAVVKIINEFGLDGMHASYFFSVSEICLPRT